MNVNEKERRYIRGRIKRVESELNDRTHSYISNSIKRSDFRALYAWLRWIIRYFKK